MEMRMRESTKNFSVLLFIVFNLLFFYGVHSQQETIEFQVNAGNVTGEWNHYWENCVGSGHAALALRADYQAFLTQTHKDLGFQQVRFHGLFVDDMSVVLPQWQGNGLLYSFFNIDRVFDFLLSIGMKPLVEISFMPDLLANGTTTWSHYQANVTPPKNWTQWSELMSAFASHLIDRYGAEEIETWNFEVWNEPNCCPGAFWTGTEDQYFYLFSLTSAALKSVNPNLKVGGPATAMSQWIPDFMGYCKNHSVTYDFISTHEYPTDPPGPQVRTFFAEHLQATREIVGPDMPLYYTEYDDGYNDDTSYSAAFAIYENYMANGIVDALSWWPFSDLFEEGGLYPTPFSSGPLPVDGLMNVYGIPKPSYRAFQLMHWSGNQLVETTPNLFWSNAGNETINMFSVLNSQNSSLSVFLLNWNVKNLPILENTTALVTVNGLPASDPLSSVMYRIDSTHANAYPAWLEMGSPLYLSPKQVSFLLEASELVPENIQLTTNSSSGSVQFQVPVPAYSVVNVIINY